MNEKEDPLAFLLRLNLELAAREEKGAAVTLPGFSKAVSNSAEFVTQDCVRPPGDA